MAAKPKMTPEQWASTRAAWEADPRKALPWLIPALGLPVSVEALRLRARSEEWTKHGEARVEECVEKSEDSKLAEKPKLGPNAKLGKAAPKLAKLQKPKLAEVNPKLGQLPNPKLGADLPSIETVPDALADDEILASAGSEPSGRPPLYRTEYAAQAKNYTLLGADDAQLAEFFDVSERTIHRWKTAYPEFAEALRLGKAEADARVAHSLYTRATGCSHPDTHVSNFQGEITLTPITKHYPPDVQAATFWLKNRQPAHWKERVEMKAEIKGDPFPPKEVLDAIYAKAMIEAAQMEAKLVGRRERLGITFEHRASEED